MDQKFNFTPGIKTFTYILMAVGVLSLGLTYAFDHTDHKMEFWATLLQNSLLFTGIGFMAIFFYCCQVLMYSGWHVQFKRIYEACSQFLYVGFILLLILLVAGLTHTHHLFHWLDPEAVAHDELLQHKSSFLNPMWFSIATVVIVGSWCFFVYKIRQVSVSEDSLGFGANYASMKKWAAIFLPVGGFSSTAIIWYWIMSVDPHWYSTLYAWYTTASWLVSMVAVIVLFLLYLKSKGYYEGVTSDHLHDLGKYLFAFSILWSYLWFDQFMLIWYANVGEETIYFDTRLKMPFKPVFFINLAINFLFPFLLLMRNSNKRKVGTMALAAGAILLGHWIDFFQIIRPGLYSEAQAHATHAGHLEQFTNDWAGFPFPSILDLGSMLFFVGIFLFVTFTSLSKAPLVAKNDAYLDESLHHHVV